MFKIRGQKKFHFNIFFASVAMLGIIAMQIIWFVNDYNLKNELFDYKVNVALKSIVNQMLEKKHETNKAIFCEHFCKYQNENVIEHIDKATLDSLILIEFESLKIDKIYNYAVFKKKDNYIVLSNLEKDYEKIFNSPYCISLSCVSISHSNDDNFFLALHFPEKKIFILKQMALSLFVALSLFIILIITYYRTTRYYYKLLKLTSIKADFINNMTHEFKTPIATISLANEVLKKNIKTQNNEIYEKYIEIIRKENERLKTQVNRILQISLIEKEELIFDFENFDTHEIISKCVESFNTLLKEKNGHIEIQFEAGKSIIRGDKIHFYNVLSNLIDNALKYNTSDTPQIKIVTKNTDNIIQISVSDNGIGILKEYRSQIFNQFFRVPTGNIHNIKGFGLGLFYVKTIVGSLGGEIKLESSKNTGSEFAILLPIIKDKL